MQAVKEVIFLRGVRGVLFKKKPLVESDIGNPIEQKWLDSIRKRTEKEIAYQMKHGKSRHQAERFVEEVVGTFDYFKKEKNAFFVKYSPTRQKFFWAMQKPSVGRV